MVFLHSIRLHPGGAYIQLYCHGHSLEEIPFYSTKEITDFHKIDYLSTVVHDFGRRMLTLLSVDEILLTRNVNCSTCFRGLPHKVEITPSLKHMDMNLRSSRVQWLLSIALGYTDGIRQRWVYLREALYHLC